MGGHRAYRGNDRNFPFHLGVVEIAPRRFADVQFEFSIFNCEIGFGDLFQPPWEDEVWS